MKHDEAKLILQVSRPGDEAAADPRLAEALALAESDRELGEWLAGERRWDAAIRRELTTVPAPADLREQILAAPKIVALPGAEAPGGFFSWRSPLAWAIAAVLVVFLGFAFNWTRSQAPENLAAFAGDMIAATPMDAHHVEEDNSNLTQVKAWLAEHHAAADLELPPNLKNAPGLMGCRVIPWHGRTVSMLCFLMNGSNHVDLFVVPANGVADPPAPGQPRFAAVDQQMMAAWSNGGNVYLMTGKVPEDFLRHCLETTATAAIHDPLALGLANY